VSADIPADLLRVALNMQLAREERTRFFERDLFGEAGWDILLAVYIAHGRGYRMKVSDACFEARVPGTTALRWLEHVVRTGLVRRVENSFDRRSSLVSITDQGIAQLNKYLSEVKAILSRR
jgi:DNA-binding MarR family transcriptional regulator